MPKPPQDTTAQSRLGRAAEQRTRQLRTPARRPPRSTSAPEPRPKLAGAAADKLVGQGFKIGAKAASALASLLVAALMGGFVLTMTGTDQLRRFPLPDAPTHKQAVSMPPHWATVAYRAQEATRQRTFGIPWTLIAGLMKVQSDFGRASPYDSVDRDPERDPKFGPPPGLQGSSGAQASASTYTGPVYVAGGALAAQLRPALGSKLSNTLQFHARGGRSADAAVAALEADRGSLPGVVVVDLGIPRGVTRGAFTGLVDRVMRTAGAGTDVYWLNAHDGSQQAAARTVNDSLAAGAARHTNLHVLDWAAAAADSPATVASDGHTPTAQGVQARARLVAAAVEATAATAGFQSPLAAGSYHLASGFGMREHPVDGTRKFHSGLDFAAPSGTAVHAAAAGRVISAGFNNGGFGED